MSTVGGGYKAEMAHCGFGSDCWVNCRLSTDRISPSPTRRLFPQILLMGLADENTGPSSLPTGNSFHTPSKPAASST